MIFSGTTFKENGCQKSYNRTLPLVEGLEALESQAAMMVANPSPEGLESLLEAVQTGEHRRFFVIFSFFPSPGSVVDVF